MKPRATAIVAALSLCACAAGNIEVRDAWVRTPAPGATSVAAYLTLVNGHDQTAELLGAHAPLFDHAMIHATRDDDGLLRMVRATPLQLAPGETIEFRPGSLHVMLAGPRRPLREGERIEIELRFANHAPLRFGALVRDEQP